MNIVKKDNSTFKQKVDAVLIDHPEYLSSIYWAKKDALDEEYTYPYCCLSPKNFYSKRLGKDCETKKGNGQLSEFFEYETTDALKNDLFVTRFTVPIKTPRKGKFYELNTSHYILNTTKPSKNHPEHPLQFVLLYRYDANSSDSHFNDFLL